MNGKNSTSIIPSVKEVDLGNSAYSAEQDALVDYDLHNEDLQDLDTHNLMTLNDDGSTSVESSVKTKAADSKEETKASPSKLTPEEQTLLRSVFVKNVDFASTVDEIK